MSRFLKESLADMEPYVPGEQPKDRKLIKLNTNESPFPPSPEVHKAISREEIEKLRLYSDPEARELLEAAENFYQVRPGQIMAGNGSDELLAFAFMAYGKKIYYPNVSYGFYKVYGKMYAEKTVEIPLSETLRVRPEDYYGLDGTILLANPNAPTGIALTREEISQILRENRDNLVIIDEAYVDFGGESVVPLLDEFDNLLVLQTLSKSRSLAGARIGLAIGNPELICDLNRIKFSFNPYNLNRLSILAGAAALRDREYFQDCCRKIVNTRENFTRELEEMGFHVLPSKANFVFARPPVLTGLEYYEKLREQDILVRYFDNPLISDYVRISIGTAEEMARIIQWNNSCEGFRREER